MRDIFRADAFVPCSALSTKIGLSRGPWHREHVRVLDPEFELQALAPVAAVDTVSDARPFLFRPFLRLLCGLIVYEAVALDHMQRLRVRSAQAIDHRVCANLYTNSIDDQRVALIVAH